MNFLKELFQKEITKRICVLLVLCLFFYIIRGLLDVFLLTFLFAYMIYSIQDVIIKFLSKHRIKYSKLAITIILYCILIVTISLAIYSYVPVLANQSQNIFKLVTADKIKTTSLPFAKYITPLIKDLDLSKYITSGSTYVIKAVSAVGNWSVNVFISIMLSMFFMLEIEKNKKFMKKLGRGKMAWISKYLSHLAKNFLNSFGKVIQAQIMIALINSLLSVIFLRILGFPQLLALGFMIFLLSLIPVAGVIISLVPLSIIAFNIGGAIKIVYVILMIIVLHALETYILNPKLMSAKTDLPVFFVFVILLISQHFMGVWGLLLGIPLFMFLLDLLGVNVSDSEINKKVDEEKS